MSTVFFCLLIALIYVVYCENCSKRKDKQECLDSFVCRPVSNTKCQWASLSSPIGNIAFCVPPKGFTRKCNTTGWSDFGECECTNNEGRMWRNRSLSEPCTKGYCLSLVNSKACPCPTISTMPWTTNGNSSVRATADVTSQANLGTNASSDAISTTASTRLVSESTKETDPTTQTTSTSAILLPDATDSSEKQAAVENDGESRPISPLALAFGVAGVVMMALACVVAVTIPTQSPCYKPFPRRKEKAKEVGITGYDSVPSSTFDSVRSI
eukprot:TRINITY_DN1006_c0_g1_i1.p1 TRINITY_DN1006_c0_g1~~TRINITY_DN1006_c0_g1_i1.p1  ORF type:complete len:283 (-),score=26.24 TRINITY_DN1006_c0_g1_i1:54-860(-)